MTTTQTRTRTYATVRPGMTVRTYSGTPIEVTEVRHMVNRVGDRWVAVVELTGWLGWSGDSTYVEHCHQLPERRTEVLHVDPRAEHAAFWASVDDDAAMMRTAYSYSRRYVELCTSIRI